MFRKEKEIRYNLLMLPSLGDSYGNNIYNMVLFLFSYNKLRNETTKCRGFILYALLRFACILWNFIYSEIVSEEPKKFS